MIESNFVLFQEGENWTIKIQWVSHGTKLGIALRDAPVGYRKTLDQMANRHVEYTSRHRLWNVDVGFRITEMIFTLRVNGKDFYELEEANKSEEKEEKVYRIGTRSDE